jgi:type III pantothenate kinase
MLTIDIGNSSIKWAIWQDGQPILAESNSYHKESIQQAFEGIFSGAPKQEKVWVACVASRDIELALTEWMQQQWSIDPVFLESQSEFGGVLNAYPDPAELGADRWAALLGAKSLYKNSVCIVDIGTAVTVDLLSAEGTHRGGRIMPGIDMMRESLLHNTVGVNAVEGECPGFAINTADAVSSGTMHMLTASLVDVLYAAKDRMGEDVRIIITGGMAETVMPFLKEITVCHEPHIVLHGLFYASEQQP